jgi:tetratricopeptide (TPR) repeat protein
MAKRRSHLRQALARLRSASWWQDYGVIPLLLIAMVGAGIAHHFYDFWPFYVFILLMGLLARYKDGLIKYGSVCLALLAIAYATYLGEQSVTTIATFRMASEHRATDLGFDGQTAANIVRDGLNAVGRAALGDGGRFPCPDSAAPSDISLSVSNHDDVLLGTDLQPHIANDIATPESVIGSYLPQEVAFPEPAALEVKGVSLSAVLSTVRNLLHTERLISGELIPAGTDSFLMIARSQRGDGPWIVGPYPATQAGLQNAGCQMAESILKDINPNLVGEAYINSRRQIDAIELYNEHVSSEVRYSPDALVLDGAARMQLKSYEVAIDKFQSALLARPDDTRIIESLGLAYAAAGNYANAFNQFDRALKRMPSSMRGRNHYDRGVAYFMQRDYDDSIREFQSAVQDKPDFVPAYFYLGSAYQETRHYANAIKAYQSALASRPHQPSDTALICMQLGNVFDLNGEPAKAIEEYRATQAHFFSLLLGAAENLDANFKFAVMGLRIGTVQRQHHLEDSGAEAFGLAEGSLRHILDKNSQYPDALHFLVQAQMLRGTVFFGDGMDDQAIEEWKSAIAEARRMIGSPNRPDESEIVLGSALILRGNAYLHKHEDRLAGADARSGIEVLQKVGATSSRSGDAKHWLARAHTLQAHLLVDAGRESDAINELNVALMLNSPFPEASRLLAVAYTNRGFKDLKSAKAIQSAQSDFDDASKQLRSVLSTESDAPSLLGRAYVGSAAAYVMLRQYPEAIAACNTAIQYLQQSPAFKTELEAVESQCKNIANPH